MARHLRAWRWHEWRKRRTRMRTIRKRRKRRRKKWARMRVRESVDFDQRTRNRRQKSSLSKFNCNLFGISMC